MSIIHAISMASITSNQSPTEWNPVLEKEWVEVVSTMYEATQSGFYYAVHHFSEEARASEEVREAILARLTEGSYEVDTNSFFAQEQSGIMISWEKFSGEHWEDD